MKGKTKKKRIKILWLPLLAMLLSSLSLPARAEGEDRATSYDRTFNYTGGIQQYTVPVDGCYKLEVWGASGGDGATTIGHTVGGTGGYSCGYVNLNAGTTLYVVIGGSNKPAQDTDWDGDDGDRYRVDVTNPGGYNGGGAGKTYETDQGDHGWVAVCGAGGGATHIATRSGLLRDLESYKSDVLIVAGGGGGASAACWASGATTMYQGGTGGGTSGGLASVAHSGTGNYTYPSATQSSGYAFGVGESNAFGGGGGWYGGYHGSGGSGYVGGCLFSLRYDGTTCNSYTSSSSNVGHGRAVVTYLGPVRYQQIVQVRYENADGTFTGYSTVIDKDCEEGESVSWSRDADGTYKEAGVDYTVTADHTEQITVYRQLYHQTLQVRYENADGTFTEYEDVLEQDYRAENEFTWSRAADEIYQEAGLTYTVEEDKDTQVTVYRQLYEVVLDMGTGIASVSGSGSYRAEQKVIISAELQKGYAFKGWSISAPEDEPGDDLEDGTGEDSGEGSGDDFEEDSGEDPGDDPELVFTENRNTFVMPTENIAYTASAELAEYSITYILDGGTNDGSNPTSYTVKSEDIELKPPSREGYDFAGWVGADAGVPQIKIIIPKGSTGNRVYTASWHTDEDDKGSSNDDGNEGYVPSPSAPVRQKTPTLWTKPSDDDDDEFPGFLYDELPIWTPVPAPTSKPDPGVAEKVEVPNEIIGVSAHQWDNTIQMLTKVAAAAGTGSAGGGTVFFIFFWLFRKCKIYDGQDDKLIGRALIRKGKKGMFMVKIPEAVCEQAGTKIYLIFGKNFVKANPGKPIKIVAREKEFYRGIEQKVDLKI